MAAGKYGLVRAATWRRTAPLSSDARLLHVYVLTSPHGRPGGLQELPAEYILADLGASWARARLDAALAELAAADLVLHDIARGLTLATDWPAQDPLAGVNVAVGAARFLLGQDREAAPRSVLERQAALLAREVARVARSARDKGQTTATLDDLLSAILRAFPAIAPAELPITETVQEPFPNPSERVGEPGDRDGKGWGNSRIPASLNEGEWAPAPASRRQLEMLAAAAGERGLRLADAARAVGAALPLLAPDVTRVLGWIRQQPAPAPGDAARAARGAAIEGCWAAIAPALEARDAHALAAQLRAARQGEDVGLWRALAGRVMRAGWGSEEQATLANMNPLIDSGPDLDAFAAAAAGAAP